MKLARIVLGILGLMFVIQGSAQLFQPELLTDLISISAASVTGRIELQVVYGGLHIALGGICLWGALNARNTRSALTAMLFVSLGIAIPRVALGLYQQDFSAYSIAAMSIESFCVVLLVYLLKTSRH